MLYLYCTYLHASILLLAHVNCDEGSGHLWVEAAVQVPVAVVLMPDERTASAGFLHHQLGVIVVHLTTQQL